MLVGAAAGRWHAAVVRVVVGIFVGGRSSRMGRPKGLLAHPEGGLSLVEHAVREARAAGLEPELVGAAEAYAALAPEVPRLPDAPGEGPLAGLVALLERAPGVIALACDMPFVRAEHLAALRDAPRSHAIAAARGPRGWEPFLARYERARVLDVARARLREGRGGLVRLVEAVGALEVALPEGVTRDWDTPEDVG